MKSQSNAHWNNVVAKEFMYFCVSQVPSQNYGLVCAMYMPSGSFPIAGSLKVYVPRVSMVYMGFVPSVYSGGVNLENPRTSLGSLLITEAIGG